jgi:lipoyl(octanoyl) transferase
MRRVDFGPNTSVGDEYRAAYARMMEEADAIAKGTLPESLWVGEHRLTVTLGRSLKAKSQVLTTDGRVDIVEIERGGGATLHNLGQVVAYPLVRLEAHGLSPVSYLRLLEEVIISALREDGIEAQAVAGQTGVWVGAQKIASLGVAVKDGIARHGLALNVSNDLSDFSVINPCGFTAETMTRVQSFAPQATFEDYRERIAAHLLIALKAATSVAR